MAGNVQALMGGWSLSSCTASGADSDWTALGTTATLGPTSNRTITVPSGNSGTLKLGIVKTGSGTMKYSKNGGAFTTFVQNDTVVFANSDTLKFEMTATASLSSMIGPVTDNTTSATVGNVDVENTS